MHQLNGYPKEDAHREVVRRAVGFTSADDLKNPSKRKAYRRWQLDSRGMKYEAHQSHAPFHIIMRLTAKAIEKEGDGRKWHQDLEDLQQYVCCKKSWVCENYKELSDELGMQRWRVLHHAYIADKQKQKRGGQELKLPQCRWVLDIVEYCCDEDEATKHKQSKVRPGFNKREDSVVVLLPFQDMINRIALATSHSPHPNHPRSTRHVYNVARFDPMLTAFLAAMAPGSDHRFLVIKYAIHELIQFNLLMHTDRETKEEYQWLPGKLNEWYALHLLRRMFRMRFGCSMFPQPEQSGRIQDIRLQEDLGWQAYKDAVGKAFRRLSQEV